MTKDRTPDPAPQPCLGPEGHYPPNPLGHTGVYRHGPTGNSGNLYLKAENARLGAPCIGEFSTTLQVGQTLEATPVGNITILGEPARLTFHAAYIAFVRGTGPDDPLAHTIRVEADENNDEHYTYSLDGLAPRDVSHFVTEWEQAWKKLKSAGRPPGATTYPRDLIRDKVREANRLKAEGKSWGQIVAHTGIDKTTIHRWVTNTKKTPDSTNKRVYVERYPRETEISERSTHADDETPDSRNPRS